MFVFLMCSERSGSNFVTKLMNAHSQFVGPSTKHLFNPILRNYFRYGDLTDAAAWELLLIDVLRLYRVDFSVWRLELDLPTLRAMAAPGDLAGLLTAIFQAEAALDGAEHVFVKENQLYEFFPFLLTHFPQAHYLYLARDPRDMALSWKSNENIPGGVVRAARQWKTDQQQSLKNAALLDAQGRLIRLRYEELVADPVAVMSGVCDFLSVPYEPAMLDFHTDELTQANARMNSAWANLSRSVMTDNRDKWVGKLSDLEVRAVEAICRHEMRHLGYGPSNDERVLAAVSDDELEALDRRERCELTYSPTDGVRDNMSAKAVLYRR